MAETIEKRGRGRPRKYPESYRQALSDGLANGDSLKALSKSLGIPYATIKQWAENDPHKKQKADLRKLYPRILSMRCHGATRTRIAQELGLSPCTVASILQRSANKDQFPPVKRVYKPKARVAEALREHVGLSVHAISKETGISRMALRRALQYMREHNQL